MSSTFRFLKPFCCVFFLYSDELEVSAPELVLFCTESFLLLILILATSSIFFSICAVVRFDMWFCISSSWLKLLPLSSLWTNASRLEAAVIAIALSSSSPSLIFFFFCYFFLIYSVGVECHNWYCTITSPFSELCVDLVKCRKPSPHLHVLVLHHYCRSILCCWISLL